MSGETTEYRTKELTLADLIAFASAGAFLASVAYLFGYTRSGGVNITQYLAVEDYLRLAIQWLPGCAASILGGLVLHFFFKRVEKGKSEEQLAAESRNPRFTRMFRLSADLVVEVPAWLMGPLATVLSFFIRIPKEILYGFWMFSGPVLWIQAFSCYLREPKFARNWTKRTLIATFALPALIVYAFCYGGFKAARGLGTIESSDVAVSVRANPGTLEGGLLLLSDGYLVLRQKDGRIAAIPRSEVTMIIEPTQSKLPGK